MLHILLPALLLSIGNPALGMPAAKLCGDLGLDGKATQRVLQGEIVRATRDEISDRDLAVTFVFLSHASPQEMAAGFRRGVDLASDSHVVQWHRIAQAGAAGDFEDLRLRPHADEETRRYLSVQPGDGLNLSEREMSAFRALGPSASTPTVEAQVRKMLLARHDAYRRGGIAALWPYARSKGQQRELGEGIRVLTRAPLALQRYAKAVQALIRDYPRIRPADGDEAFYWIVYDQDNRPTLTLRHRMTQVVGEATIVVDREFYVSQGHNEMQALAAFIPVDAGTLVVYRADTSTDRVSGAGAGMKHSIGRRLMANQLQAIFERTRLRFKK